MTVVRECDNHQGGVKGISFMDRCNGNVGGVKG